MSSEVWSVSERSPAVVAWERLLASVSTDVSLEKPRTGESFTAQVTLTRQGVSPYVHLESTQRSVHLRAVLAAKRFPSETSLGGSAVVLLMFWQSWVGGVGLSTVWALVTRAAWTRHGDSRVRGDWAGGTEVLRAWRRRARGGWWCRRVSGVVLRLDGRGQGWGSRIEFFHRISWIQCREICILRCRTSQFCRHWLQTSSARG